MCPDYTDLMHVNFFTTVLKNPAWFTYHVDLFVGGQIHVLIGYSVPVAHRWLQVDLPTISLEGTSSA